MGSEWLMLRGWCIWAGEKRVACKMHAVSTNYPDFEQPVFVKNRELCVLCKAASGQALLVFAQSR